MSMSNKMYIISLVFKLDINNLMTYIRVFENIFGFIKKTLFFFCCFSTNTSTAKYVFGV